MFGFLKSLFMPQPSSETAKERLRVVLLADHLSLSPDVVDSLKSDLLGVIRRYAEIDEENADVTFEQREKEVAMLASVPILSVKGSIPSEQEDEHRDVEQDCVRDGEQASVETAPLTAVEAEAVEACESEEEEESAQALGEEPTASVESRRRRRRRRPPEVEAQPIG